MQNPNCVLIRTARDERQTGQDQRCRTMSWALQPQMCPLRAGRRAGGLRLRRGEPLDIGSCKPTITPSWVFSVSVCFEATGAWICRRLMWSELFCLGRSENLIQRFGLTRGENRLGLVRQTTASAMLGSALHYKKKLFTLTFSMNSTIIHSLLCPKSAAQVKSIFFIVGSGALLLTFLGTPVSCLVFFVRNCWNGGST